MLHSEERWDLLGREGAKAHEKVVSLSSVGGEAKKLGLEQKEERHIACDNSFATLQARACSPSLQGRFWV